MKMKRVLSLLLALVMTFSLLTLPTYAADEDTVTVTVNYVYDSNKAMVAQPWSGQFTAGEFKRTLNIPMVENYNVDTAKSVIPSGVTLVGSKLSFDTNLTSDLTVTLYYVAGTATYTVNHYQQNLEDDGYKKISSQELTGNIDAYTEAVAQLYPGFTCTGVEQKYVVANNSTVVDIYYDRDYYKVIFDVNGGVNAPDPVYGKFGAELKANQDPSRAGYNFDGWSLTPDGDKVTLPDTLTENATYYARWTPKSPTAKVTYVIWGQNANDDEYSFKGTVTSQQTVGSTASWYQLTCDKQAHSHAESGCQLICEHTSHNISCQGINPSTPNNTVLYRMLNTTNNTPQEGYVYYYDVTGTSNDGYWTYYNGQWYKVNTNYYTGNAVWDSGSLTNWRVRVYAINQTYLANHCKHTHGADCYSCGLEEHTHDDSCYEFVMKNYAPDNRPDLWKFKESSEARVDAAGNTVVDVYYDRTEFTQTFKYRNGSETITERWGKDIYSQFQAICDRAEKASSSHFSGWEINGGSYVDNVFIMPKSNNTYEANYSNSSSTQTMTYYIEDLNGRDQMSFKVTFYGNYHVTSEEYYELEGFTINKNRSTSIGSTCSGAKFYYTRNSYKLNFFSSSTSTADRTESVKYQAGLGTYNSYKPTQKPEGVESDAVFVGWYLNPQCTGAQYILSDHTMPANDVALYAKWVNRSYTVKTFTDDSLKNLYTYDGYTGSQTVEKYKNGTEPTEPTKEGYAFVGWFYKENGVEKAFDFSMPVTKDYNLYPKFSDRVMLNYTVHYYVEGTTDKVASDTTATTMIGNTVSLKAKMGTDMDLAGDTNYFPMETSKAVRITERGQEVIFYYKEATNMTYTVKYQDEQGNTLADDKTVTTPLSVVTEQYVPVENYTPREFQKTLELSADTEKNVIIFVYDPNLTDLTINKTPAAGTTFDKNQSFIFEIKGDPDNAKTKDVCMLVTIQGEGSVTVKDLPVGTYTVKELVDWSWRYTPGTESLTKPLSVTASANMFDFVNARTNDKWLSGDSYAINTTAGANIH